MKPYVGNYGWTPQQLALVNARREERGQNPLLDQRMEDESFMKEYSSYTNPQSPINRASKYDIEKESEKGTPISKRIKSGTEDFRNKMERDQMLFREKFNKMKMIPNESRGMKGAVSSPSILDSYSRLYS